MKDSFDGAMEEVSGNEPPCDFCGDAFSSAIPVATTIEDEDGSTIAIVVSCCVFCEGHDDLITLCAERALVRMGFIEIVYDSEELN